jgi:hypothetical protein
VTVEIPMVCDTVAAGLGVRGVVIFWLRVVRVERTSMGMTAYRVIVSNGIFCAVDSEEDVSTFKLTRKSAVSNGFYASGDPATWKADAPTGDGNILRVLCRGGPNFAIIHKTQRI